MKLSLFFLLAAVAVGQTKPNDAWKAANVQGQLRCLTATQTELAAKCFLEETQTREDSITFHGSSKKVKDIWPEECGATVPTSVTATYLPPCEEAKAGQSCVTIAPPKDSAPSTWVTPAPVKGATQYAYDPLKQLWASINGGEWRRVEEGQDCGAVTCAELAADLLKHCHIERYVTAPVIGGGDYPQPAIGLGWQPASDLRIACAPQPEPK